MKEFTDNEIDLMRIAWNAGKKNHDGVYRPIDFDEWIEERFPDEEVDN